MNISFKAKIPISSCQLYDKEKKQYVHATLYEFDCKDTSDIKHFKHNFKRWVYIDTFIRDMQTKFKYYSRGFGGLSQTGKDAVNENRFYSIELPNNYIVGFCETTGTKNTKNIHYLETERERRYKYAGQSIIASLAKQMINLCQNPLMTINYPANSARKFYTDQCGFKPKDSVALQMEENDLNNFVDTFEMRTQMPISNFY